MASQVVSQLPRDARRVLVRGTSGSGKTTLARRVSAATGIPHVELDAIFHQPDWTPLDEDAFVDAVTAVADTDGWVVCGNYGLVRDVLLARADTIVLYDLPRRTVMARIVWRTLRRIARREELWNGNRERWVNLFTADPERSVIAWAWTTHARRHADTIAFLADPPRSDLRLVHLATTADERRFFEALDVAAPERAGRAP